MRSDEAPAAAPAAESVWPGFLESLNLVTSSKEMDAGKFLSVVVEKSRGGARGFFPVGLRRPQPYST